MATDPDEGGANIAYAITLADFIKNGKSQAATEVFSIDEDTGRITTNQLLTNYVKGYFDLTITATDTDTGLFATALARVKSSLFFFNLLNYACRTFCLPNRQHNCYVIISITMFSGSRLAFLEPQSNRSQHKTNGALVHSNSSVIQLLLYDVITGEYGFIKWCFIRSGFSNGSSKARFCMLILHDWPLVSFEVVHHPCTLFLKTLPIFSKNKATLDKISYASD